MSKTQVLEAEESKHKHRTVSEELLTVREVAQALRVDDTTVRRWVKHKTLDAVSLPHAGTRQAYRVRRRTLDDLLNKSTVDTEA